MTHQEVNGMVETIRDAGYIIVAFSPDEIGENTNANHLEEVLRERGQQYIDSVG